MVAEPVEQNRVWRIHPCVWIPEQFVLDPRFKDVALGIALGDALVPIDIVCELGLRRTLVEPFDPDDRVIPGGLILHTRTHLLGADPSITMAFLKEWRRLETCDSAAIWVANGRRITVNAKNELASIEECWGSHALGWCPREDLRRMLKAALSSAAEFKGLLVAEAGSSAPLKVDSIARSILL